MEIIKAGVKLYQHKNNEANGNARAQADNVDKGVRPLAVHIAPCGFKQVFYHNEVS
jgi:hypothetical protein